MSGSGGQIRQRPNGLWEGRYVGADHRRHSVYAKTRKEAQERLRTALTAADNGIRPNVSRVTVGAWLEEWLSTSVEQRCRPATIVSYRSTVELYIVPSIGRIPLSKLEPEDVQRMLTRLGRGSLSTTTVRYAYAVLRIALGRALKSGKVVRNVATLVDPPATGKRELRPLSAEQVRNFLDSIEGSRQEPLYVVAIALGLRQGELLGLRWQDVDLDAGTLTVRHTLRVGTDELAEPKTERSRRTLRLSPDVAAILRSHKARQAAERLVAGTRWQDRGFVFASPHGTPLNTSNVTHAFQAALERAGLPRQRFHDLRHAFATLQLEDGEELAVISRMLGHANFATTANVYAHITPASLQRSADRMDGILRRRIAGDGA
jgi:integrase